jgi:AraC family transcriptional regulator, transcriptional activator of the genes for pyochelin and ferripyochelin receptors
VKITFKSEDIQELNFVREYEDGFSVGGPTGLRELKSTFAYNSVHSKSHRLYIPGVITSMFESTSAGYEYYIESDFPYLQMHFELTTDGCEYLPKAQFEPETRIYTGQHALLFYPSLKGALRYLPKNNGFSVEIEITLDYFRRLFNNDLEVLRTFGEQIEKMQPALMGNRSYPVTPRMKEVLFDIRSCGYVGALKKMFVEAKVAELLTLQIDQISNGHDEPQPSLKKDDIDKLHHVRDIMLNNLVAPLSVEQLSRMAGLNRTKLQEGFKQVFGDTVFGYLTQARMEQAREMILDGKYSTIAEVASLIGYKNPQHFTAAFKKTFGYLPRDMKS